MGGDEQKQLNLVTGPEVRINSTCARLGMYSNKKVGPRGRSWGVSNCQEWYQAPDQCNWNRTRLTRRTKGLTSDQALWCLFHNVGTWEAVEGRAKVQGQSRLHSETLSQKNNKVWFWHRNFEMPLRNLRDVTQEVVYIIRVWSQERELSQIYNFWKSVESWKLSEIGQSGFKKRTKWYK